MRLQVSAKFYNPILTGALILDEEGPVAVSTISQDKITSCQKPIVIVYFHDAGHHPLMYLRNSASLSLRRQSVRDMSFPVKS